MKPFEAPLDDILFSLDHVAGAGALADWDGALAGEILGHFAAFAEGVIAPLDEPGDAQGCRLENGAVKMPDGFAAAYAELAEGGWQGLTAPETFGGMAQNQLVAAAVSEMPTSEKCGTMWNVVPVVAMLLTVTMSVRSQNAGVRAASTSMKLTSSVFPVIC